MRLRRARTRTRRLPETLPLACHDAVSGAPRATWGGTLELSEGALEAERRPVAPALAR